MTDKIDKPRDHCGVFGVYGHPQAAQVTFLGLHALQHRGQEGSGIVTSYQEPPRSKPKFLSHRGFGLVNDVFKPESIFTDVLKGESAIGHNRYSTSGASDNAANIQPIMVNYRGGNVAVAHNGNLTNFRAIRRKLQDTGTIFQTTSDTEIILHLIARSSEEEQIRQILEALNMVEGAFSLAILTDTMMVAARDPLGVRPLAVGRLGDAFLIASETCAFDIVDAEYICDVHPGEVLVFDRETLKTGEAKSFRLDAMGTPPRHCIFEYVYFSRPDSTIFNESVDKVRRKLGKALAAEFGSVEKWETDFRAVGAMRGIGWVVLYQDATGKRFFNQWVNEHDVGHPAGATPILVMDVFEHAFMTDYGLKRADYIAAFFKNIDWKAAEARLK